MPGAWSIRPRDGKLAIDFEFPAPEPAPVTTIAWRLGHVIVGVFAMRNASHFGGPPVDYGTFEWAGDAATALAQLDVAYAGWVAGVRGLDEARLGEPVGPAEGPFADRPYADLVLHIHREAIHHLAEVALLRDLYSASSATG